MIPNLAVFLLVASAFAQDTGNTPLSATYLAEAANGGFAIPVTILSMHSVSETRSPNIPNDGGTDYCTFNTVGNMTQVSCGNVNLAPLMNTMFTRHTNAIHVVMRFDKRGTAGVMRCEANCPKARRWDDPLSQGEGQYLARLPKKRGVELLELRDGKPVISKWIGIEQ
jgi:hypothetical protein